MSIETGYLGVATQAMLCTADRVDLIHSNRIDLVGVILATR
jgi:hypothetical protein